jgi:hypothetical protein
MSTQHPITPPPELVEKWANQSPYINPDGYIAAQAAQWGADTELEACVNWLDQEGWSGESRHLRAARLPKPPSLKEQALQLLKTYNTSSVMLTADQADTIRRALEAM